MYIKYIVIIVLLLGLLFVVEQFRPADAYYYDNAPLGFVWSGPPLFCVWDSDYNKHAKEAISNWQYALVDNYGEKFHFPAALIQSDTPFEYIQNCKIHLIYVKEKYASVEDLTDENNFVKGGIMYSRINPEYMFIYMYEARAGFFPTLEDFDNMMITSTMHEIGHALGIGHVVAENMQEKLKPWPNTLMWPFGGHDTHKTVYPQDLDAFKCLYYEKIWFGNNPDYCPTHYTEFPLRPDPFTGNITMSFK